MDKVASGRETRELGKASHRGHGGHRGGTGVVDESFGLTGWLLGGKCTHWMKASHRGHGGHRGGDLVHQDLHPLLWPLCDAFPIALPGGGHKRGPGVMDESLGWTGWLSGRETRREGHIGAVLTVPASKLSIVV